MKVAIFGKKHHINQIDFINKLLNLLKEKGVEIHLFEEFYTSIKKQVNINSKDFKLFKKNEINTDIAISIGGDGTFSKTAKEIGSKNIPILGINTGRLGFLTDALPKDVETVLDEIINKHYCIEERSVLELSCCNKKFAISPYALNEIAILKRDSSSMITIHASINNTYINSYQADGLVIATPTGTTAYSLSVGGPIIVPYTDTIAITPVAPHSLNVRPIVIRDDWEITLEVESRSHNFLVALDGESITCKENNKLIIKKAKHCVKVIKRSNHTFFDSLRDKMMWGADNRKGAK